MTELTISVEDNPVPVVLVFAARMRRFASSPAFERIAGRLAGTVTLQSTATPETVTIEFKQGHIHLYRRAPEHSLTVYLDLDTGEVKRISHAWRHPLMALRVRTLMRDYSPRWQDSAKHFWQAASQLQGIPPGVKIHCLDDNSTLELGTPESAMEIEGTAGNLAALFGGELILADAILKKKIATAGRMQHMAVFSEATMMNLLGAL